MSAFLAAHATAAALAFALDPVFAAAWCRLNRFRLRFPLAWAAYETADMIAALTVRHWVDAGMFAGVALAALLLDWWRRKGCRIARAVGAKSAALVAGLVERVREAGGAVPEGAAG